MFPLLLREEQESIKIRTVTNLKAGIFTDAHCVIYKNRSSPYKFELLDPTQNLDIHPQQCHNYPNPLLFKYDKSTFKE